MRKLRKVGRRDGEGDELSPGEARRSGGAANSDLGQGGDLGQLGEAVTFAPWSAPRGRQAGCGGQACIEAVNITSLATAFPHVVARKAIMVLTEHSTHRRARRMEEEGSCRGLEDVTWAGRP